MSGQGYRLHLWYDSDALLAWQTDRLIVEAAKADAMQQGGNHSISAAALGTLYEERVIVLKQQMFMHIQAALEQGLSADEARVDLLARAYGQDAADLETRIEQNRRSLLDLAGGDLQLRDLHDLDTPLQLQTIYERETRLRGNLAAASDVVRVEALYNEGGAYADVDNLPPLARRLGALTSVGSAAMRVWASCNCCLITTRTGCLDGRPGVTPTPTTWTVYPPSIAPRLRPLPGNSPR